MLLTVFDCHPDYERWIKMEDEKDPNISNSILFDKRLQLPVDITEWVFVKSSNILEGSPFLGHISWFSCGHNELCEITISFFSKSSILIYVNFKSIKLIHLLTFQSCQLFHWCWAHHGIILEYRWFFVWSEILGCLYRIDTQSYSSFLY